MRVAMMRLKRSPPRQQFEATYRLIRVMSRTGWPHEVDGFDVGQCLAAVPLWFLAKECWKSSQDLPGFRYEPLKAAIETFLWLGVRGPVPDRRRRLCAYGSLP